MQHRVRFILKSGKDFVVHCAKGRVKTVEGQIVGYELAGITANMPLYIDIEQIAAVIDEGPIDDA